MHLAFVFAEYTSIPSRPLSPDIPSMSGIRRASLSWGITLFQQEIFDLTRLELRLQMG